jgi:hypothetical protein
VRIETENDPDNVPVPTPHVKMVGTPSHVARHGHDFA